MADMKVNLFVTIVIIHLFYRINSELFEGVLLGTLLAKQHNGVQFVQMPYYKHFVDFNQKHFFDFQKEDFSENLAPIHSISPLTEIFHKSYKWTAMPSTSKLPKTSTTTSSKTPTSTTTPAKNPSTTPAKTPSTTPIRTSSTTSTTTPATTPITTSSTTTSYTTTDSSTETILTTEEYMTSSYNENTSTDLTTKTISPITSTVNSIETTSMESEKLEKSNKLVFELIPFEKKNMKRLNKLFRNLDNQFRLWFSDHNIEDMNLKEAVIVS